MNGVIGILKRISAFIAAVAVILTGSAYAYNVVDLPESMSFADALGIFDTSEIESASICDTEANLYRNLSETEIKDFYYAASGVTVWRKINPTPFRGVCINFTTTSGSRISYYFNAGIQIGTYGVDNYICYMPAREDEVKLSYLESEFYDTKEGVYGGTQWNVCTTRDFLKLPADSWAVQDVKVAAARSLVPYDFTNKYDKKISREELARLIANFIAVCGNYANADAYMAANGIAYRSGVFYDCAGRDDAIDQLYALGIVSGKNDGEFAPDAAVSRQELAVFLVKTAEKFMYIGTNYGGRISDRGKIGSWAEFHVKWTLENGVMSLDDAGRFNPTELISVEQAIAALNRLSTVVTYWED